MTTAKEIQITPKELRKIMSDYEWEADIMEDDDESIRLHNSIDRLNEGDRIILCLYAEYHSIRTVARILGVSYSAARKQINKIKNEIVNGCI